MSRTIAIGDVHGCAEEFEELLQLLRLPAKDRLIRWRLDQSRPDSHGAVRIARENGIEAILGNHELRILTALRESRPGMLKDYDLKIRQRTRMTGSI